MDWVERIQLGPRVISVGNIQAGGAGKTPLVAQIAKEATDRGLKTCILIRGYKSRWESLGGVILPGDTPVNTQDCGDEAALLHDLCPGVFLGVGADRVRQYHRVLEKVSGSLDLVILDDGFQNWRIHKDVEIVALTSVKRSQYLFRDWSRALRAADLLVWTKGDVKPSGYSDKNKKSLVRVQYQLTSLNEEGSFWLVTGIADGQSAYQLATRSGYRIERHLALHDHESYDEYSVQKIREQAMAAGCRVALTGKDWVKWRDLGVSRSEVAVLEPELRFEEGRENWSRILWGS